MYSVWFMIVVVDICARMLAEKGAGPQGCAALQFADGGKKFAACEKLLRKLDQVCNRKEKKQRTLPQQRQQAWPEECVYNHVCVLAL